MYEFISQPKREERLLLLTAPAATPAPSFVESYLGGVINIAPIDEPLTERGLTNLGLSSDSRQIALNFDGLRGFAGNTIGDINGFLAALLSLDKCFSC